MKEKLITKKTKMYVTYFSWIVGFIGIIVTLLNMIGCFEQKDRLDLYRLLVYTDSKIPRDHHAMTAFIREFPPHDKFKESNIEYLEKTIKIGTSKQTFDGKVRYIDTVGNGSENVASIKDIEKWSKENNYDWICLFIIIIAYLLFISSDVIDIKIEKGK